MGQRAWILGGVAVAVAAVLIATVACLGGCGIGPTPYTPKQYTITINSQNENGEYNITPGYDKDKPLNLHPLDTIIFKNDTNEDVWVKPDPLDNAYTDPGKFLVPENREMGSWQPPQYRVDSGPFCSAMTF